MLLSARKSKQLYSLYGCGQCHPITDHHIFKQSSLGASGLVARCYSEHHGMHIFVPCAVRLSVPSGTSRGISGSGSIWVGWD